MPYNSVSDVPASVPKDKRRQWMAVWNSSYKEHHDESRAFAEAWAAIGGKDGKGCKAQYTSMGNIAVELPDGKLRVLKAVGTEATGFVRAVDGPFRCGHCEHNDEGQCTQKEVIADPEVKELLNDEGYLPVEAGDCCNEYDPVKGNKVKKYSDDQPRDDHGRWSGSGGGTIAGQPASNWSKKPKDLSDKEIKQQLDELDRIADNHGELTGEAERRYNELSNEYSRRGLSEKTVSAEKAKAMTTQFKKFIPFAKVDAVKREVWGIVTAEVPDKDNEVCDYEGSKPFYQAVIAEMAKATDGKNFFPLREMHQLSAVGKGVGFEFRDPEKEIFMGFKVVDDDAWKKVDEGVYTGFSHGGTVVGDMKPDPVFKDCMRYVANPSEVSVVDNPCLGVAHFAYVKADGAVELRKVRQEVKTPVLTPEEVETVKAAKTILAKEAARLGLEQLRRPVRVWVHRRASRIGKLSHRGQDLFLYKLDQDLSYLTRKQPLAKGLYEVSRLACSIQDLCWMAYSIRLEEMEEGETPTFVPQLSEHVTGLLDTFLEYAEHEVAEVKEAFAGQ